MVKTKIAIVIPYYKLTYFEETLKSLANQTNKNFSLYIGNDNSPEDPKDVIDKYTDIITSYKKFEANLGGEFLTKHWERCIDTMVKEEEWVMLLCDDDLLSENYINKFYLHLDKVNSLNISLIKYNCKIINNQGKFLRGFYNYNELENSLLFFKKLMYYKVNSTLSENIFRKDKYFKYKFQNIEVAFGSDIIALLEFSEFSDIYMIADEYMSFRYSTINISGNLNDSLLKKRKMIGNSQYMYYLLSRYPSFFDNETKLLMCRKLYKNFRAVHRNDVILNFKYFKIILKSISLNEAFKLIFYK